MKSISPALKAELATDTTNIVTCWKVTRADSTVFAFTDHDQNLIVDGVTYKAATGYTASDIATNSNLDVDNLELDGLLDDDSITADDLRSGLWDAAEVRIFQVNWADLTQGVVYQRVGHLGEVTTKRGNFVAELRGLTQAYTKVIGELTTPGCRADLGDARCGVDLSGFTVTGVIEAVSSDGTVLTDSSRTEPGPTDDASGYFDYGKITFDSGENAGFSMEIKSYVPGEITLQLPMPYTVAIGDIYTAIAGCDKKMATCLDRFSNVVNFRGEPYLPGIDQVLQVGRRQ